MKYRHAFHAGNYADVHKHVALLSLLAALQRKDKGLLYLESHAGRGWYPSTIDASAQSEAGSGLRALAQHASAQAELQCYLDTVQRCRESAAEASGIPGSPVLAAAQLRPQDRAVLCEIQSAECRALARALHPYRRARALCGDGWQQLSALLPPREHRALVLIDPPYETGTADFSAALAGIGATLQRIAQAVILLWYPIKDARELQPWLLRAQAELTRPTLLAELWWLPRDSRAGLNGSGLMIVNPPYQWDARLPTWQQGVLDALGVGDKGGQAIRWLVHESG